MANKFAIVTGASTGIGFELASLAAEDGYDLLVVADEPLIDAAAARFPAAWRRGPVGRGRSFDDSKESTRCSPPWRAVASTCCAPMPVRATAARSSTRTVHLATHDRHQHGRAPLYLVQKVLKDMVSRGEGRVLVTGSIAGYVPGPFNAVYNATKAFIDNFTDALREELKDYDGDVVLTTLMPGATDTEFFARADMLDTEVGRSKSKADPAKARAGRLECDDERRRRASSRA